ncbi:MAG: hypothetical protein ACRD3S_09370, partial [Terracidiphilus sp.]
CEAHNQAQKDRRGNRDPPHFSVTHVQKFSFVLLIRSTYLSHSFRFSPASSRKVMRSSYKRPREPPGTQDLVETEDIILSPFLIPAIFEGLSIFKMAEGYAK